MKPPNDLSHSFQIIKSEAIVYLCWSQKYGIHPPEFINLWLGYCPKVTFLYSSGRKKTNAILMEMLCNFLKCMQPCGLVSSVQVVNTPPGTPLPEAICPRNRSLGIKAPNPHMPPRASRGKCTLDLFWADCLLFEASLTPHYLCLCRKHRCYHGNEGRA